MGLLPCFQLPDKGIGILGVIFSNICFNPGCIKCSHVGRGRVDALAYRLSKIDQMLKEVFQVIREVLLKMSEF